MIYKTESPFYLSFLRGGEMTFVSKVYRNGNVALEEKPKDTRRWR